MFGDASSSYSPHRAHRVRSNIRSRKVLVNNLEMKYGDRKEISDGVYSCLCCMRFFITLSAEEHKKNAHDSETKHAVNYVARSIGADPSLCDDALTFQLTGTLKKDNSSNTFVLDGVWYRRATRAERK